MKKNIRRQVSVEFGEIEYVIIYPRITEKLDFNIISHDRDNANFFLSPEIFPQVAKVFDKWAVRFAKYIGYADHEDITLGMMRDIFFIYNYNGKDYCRNINLYAETGYGGGFLPRTVQGYYITPNKYRLLNKHDLVPVFIDSKDPIKSIFFDFTKRLNTYSIILPSTWHNIDQINFSDGINWMNLVKRYYKDVKERKLMKLSINL